MEALREVRVHRPYEPRDLRGEKHKAELSGPVRTYRIRERLDPTVKRDRLGMGVNFLPTSFGCIYLGADVRQLLVQATHVTVEWDNLQRTLIIKPSDGASGWKLYKTGKHGLAFGTPRLARMLLDRGLTAGRHPAQVENGEIVVRVSADGNQTSRRVG